MDNINMNNDKHRRLLSKSSFVSGCQCTKLLYLYKHFPELKDEISAGQQAVFDKGHKVGELAQQLFPGGINLQEKYKFDFDSSISEVKELQNEKDVVIYEAPFLFNEVLSILDILVCKEGKWYAYEVKSSTSVSDTYLLDVALQYWVMSNCGLQFAGFSIIYINNQYVRNGALELDKLFKIESVLEKILFLQPFISQKVDEFIKILESKDVPLTDIGEHCFEPYSCAFHGHCWKHVPDYSIFDISRLNMKNKFELYYKGIIEPAQVPENFNLSNSQRLQIDCEKSQTTIIEKENIKAFLSQFSYPLYFLDFEIFQPAVPMFDNSRAYQMITFQYSLHYLESKDAVLQHFEFLAEANEKVDPRIPFIRQLISDTKNPGVIIVYNQAFEVTRLKELASDFPQYSTEINEIISLIIDLMVPFQRKDYYTPAMIGSYSIKKVLPALVPELSYKELEIADGGMASSAFLSLYTEAETEKINSVRQNLLKYCGLDTLAMVEILKVLEGI